VVDARRSDLVLLEHLPALLLVFTGSTKAVCRYCPQTHSQASPQSSISMYQATGRPATLDFLFPPTPYTSFGFDHRRDIGLHTIRQLTPPYSEAALQDGLRTPPADDMSTAYQHAQYNDYAARQGGTYSMSGSTRGSYAVTYPPVTNMQAKSYSASGLLPPVSTSSLRHEVQAPLTSHHPQPPSPQPANKTASLAAAADSTPSRKSSVGDMITPLQIPPSINISGGSLAEFAAQVSRTAKLLPTCH
jgi:hypothetical protein